MHVLAIGSSVIDLFLIADNNFYKLANGKVEFNLGDKVPTDIKRFEVGGNGANVSAGLTRFEIPSTFYTYLGKDKLSLEIEEVLAREGVEVISNSDKTDTPPLSFIIDFDNDRIIFSHHQKKDYSFDLDEKNYDYIYLTSIGKTWQKAYREVIEYAKVNNIPIAFSPGSTQIDDVGEATKKTIQASKMYFSNKEEAAVMLGKNRDMNDIKELLNGLHELGPEIVSITDGKNGAYAADKSGHYHLSSIHSENHEKTGAGDAYASGFFAGILHGEDVRNAMRWGVLNSYSVMQEVGAQNGLLTRQKLDKMLQERELKVEEI